MISATLDTSVYVRAFNFGGPAAILLARARAGDVRIDISEPILRETIGVLREKFQRDPYTLNDIHQKLTALCNSVSPTETLDVVKEDSNDTAYWNALLARARITSLLRTKERICFGWDVTERHVSSILPIS